MNVAAIPNAPDPIADAILELAGARGAGKSICPSEVARALARGEDGDAWRARMSSVRRVAIKLSEAGRLDILRKGKPVSGAEIRGVIRLRIRPE